MPGLRRPAAKFCAIAEFLTPLPQCQYQGGGGGGGGGGVRRTAAGLPLRTGSAACVELLDAFAEQVLSYGAEPRVVLRAAAEDPACTLANGLAAGHCLARPHGLAAAAPYLDAARATRDQATDYERLVLRSVEAAADGRPDDALQLHLELARRCPLDLLSVKRGQTLSFYLGRQDVMLQLAEMVLPANGAAPYLQGMLAFALVEVDRFQEAEGAARCGLELLPSDQWSLHSDQFVLASVLTEPTLSSYAAVARPPRDMPIHRSAHSGCTEPTLLALTMLLPIRLSLSSQRKLVVATRYTHNWWHVALCHLERGAPGHLQAVLEIYDTHLWAATALATTDNGAYAATNRAGDKSCPQDQLNALDLLLRLDLRGHDAYVDERIAGVIAHVIDQIQWHGELLLDLLMAWALSRKPNSMTPAAAFMRSTEARPDSPAERSKFKYLLRRHAFVQVAKAMQAFAREQYTDACQALGDGFSARCLKPIGASNEQLDVFEEVHCLALLRSAHDLLQLRAAKHGSVVFTSALMAQAHQAQCRAGSLDHV
eukprot:SM000031S11555  [mRNA]  locus=s31:338099:342522:+ [translate_table: standard]